MAAVGVGCPAHRRHAPWTPRAAGRWTALAGEAILDALPGFAAAPPLAIGGAVAYAPARRWVCRLDVAGEPHVGPTAAGR